MITCVALEDLDLTIDKTTGEYPYVQLADKLRAAIDSGQLDGRFPSIFQLTDKAGVAYNTVRRAVAILADEGRLVTRPGLGTFVVRRA